MKFTFIILAIFLSAFYFSIFGTDLCKVEEKLLSKTFEIDLICGYKSKKLNYDEGMFISYYYNDSTLLLIFNGSNHSLPIFSISNDYIPCFRDTICDKISIKGLKNGYYWREDIITNTIRVLYDNVSENKKELYDNILDSFRLKNE